MPNFAQQYPFSPPQNPDGEEGLMADADSEADLGSEGSDATLTDEAAGSPAGTSQQPAQETAIALLLEALGELERSGRRPAAAGVSAKMRQISPQFDPHEAGYKSFRALVTDAVGRGLVTVKPTGSDIDIHKVESLPAADSTPLRRPRRLRDDLWRAFLEWDPSAVSVFNRSEKRTRPGVSTSANDVTVPVIGQQDQRQWMREFCLTLPAGEDRESLLNALEAHDGVRAFTGSSDIRWG